MRVGEIPPFARDDKAKRGDKLAINFVRNQRSSRCHPERSEGSPIGFRSVNRSNPSFVSEITLPRCDMRDRDDTQAGTAKRMGNAQHSTPIRDLTLTI